MMWFIMGRRQGIFIEIPFNNITRANNWIYRMGPPRERRTINTHSFVINDVMKYQESNNKLEAISEIIVEASEYI